MRRRILELLGGGASAGLALVGCVGDGADNQAEVAGRAGDSDSDSGVSGPGTCTTSKKCFSPAEARHRARVMLDFDAGEEDAVAGFASCPTSLPAAGFCTYYGGLVAGSDDQCCYPETTGSCCGRPLIVEGRTLRAALRLRADWIARGGVPARAALPSALREALAQAWLEDACFEHASVGSFALFTLDLLACGAGSELVEAAQRAALDEVEHARLCFSLASGFAGRPLGPGTLDCGTRPQTRSLAEATAAAVREGCVGETLAAIQLQAQLSRAQDPVTCRALRKIARDEARHAELAFRFVRWAVGVGGEQLRSIAALEFSAALDALESASAPHESSQPEELWNAYGRLTAAQAHSVRLHAMREVVEPCAQALLRS